MTRKTCCSCQAIYNDLRVAVQNLHDRLANPLKKEAVNYVLSLFAIQERDAGALRPLTARSEIMRRAWAKRKQAMPEPPMQKATSPYSERAHRAWVTRRRRIEERKALENEQTSEM